MAEMLIETLKTEWNPTAYSDTYREELLRRIGEKAPIEERAEAAPRLRITSRGTDAGAQGQRRGCQEAEEALSESAPPDET
jgi:hypothetical protein